MISYYVRGQDHQEKPIYAGQQNGLVCLGTLKHKELKICRNTVFIKAKKKEKNSVDSLIEDGGLVSMETPFFSVFTQYVQDVW